MVVNNLIKNISNSFFIFLIKGNIQKPMTWLNIDHGMK